MKNDQIIELVEHLAKNGLFITEKGGKLVKCDIEVHRKNLGENRDKVMFEIHPKD